jgi:hypothetical protein
VDEVDIAEAARWSRITREHVGRLTTSTGVAYGVHTDPTGPPWRLKWRDTPSGTPNGSRDYKRRWITLDDWAFLKTIIEAMAKPACPTLAGAGRQN